MTEPLRREAGSHVNAAGHTKAGYHSRKLAERAIRRIRGAGGPVLYPYRCVTCPYWHLSGSKRWATGDGEPFRAPEEDDMALVINGVGIDMHPIEGAAEYRKVATSFAAVLTTDVIVHTPEGDMAGHAGDYLVTDNPPTHAWPVARDVFERTHELVTGDRTVESGWIGD